MVTYEVGFEERMQASTESAYRFVGFESEKNIKPDDLILEHKWNKSTI